MAVSPGKYCNYVYAGCLLNAAALRPSDYTYPHQEAVGGPLLRVVPVCEPCCWKPASCLWQAWTSRMMVVASWHGVQLLDDDDKMLHACTTAAV